MSCPRMWLRARCSRWTDLCRRTSRRTKTTGTHFMTWLFPFLDTIRALFSKIQNFLICLRLACRFLKTGTRVILTSEAWMWCLHAQYITRILQNPWSYHTDLQQGEYMHTRRYCEMWSGLFNMWVKEHFRWNKIWTTCVLTFGPPLSSPIWSKGQSSAAVE